MNEEFPFSFLLGLKPEEAIAYLKSKGYKITWDWHEMLNEAHNSAFTVAKAMKLDILQDIKSALEEVQQNGETFEQFRRKLEPILKAKGWWGRVPIDQVPSDSPTPLSLPRRGDGGEVVQLGSPHRLRTIYNTNIRSAYMSGKYLRFVANAENRPCWQYIAVLDKATRPQHAELDGKVFQWDDPIWNTIWPPNDWGCRCDIRALTEAQVKSMGLRIYKGTEVKFIPGKGFRHNPGSTVPLALNLFNKIKQADDATVNNVLQDVFNRLDFNSSFIRFIRMYQKDPVVRGRAEVIGMMDPAISLFIKNKLGVLENPFLIIDDKSLSHLLRDTKAEKGKAVGIDSFFNLPDTLKSASVYWDKRQPSLIFIPYDLELKFVFKVNLKRKTSEELTNFLITAGKFDLRNLSGSVYEKIR
jgi:SPP1 gp7 family putative phage head morphogenesis protein